MAYNTYVLRESVKNSEESEAGLSETHINRDKLSN